MTPTIQCFDDHSMQMPPASVLRNNLCFQESSQTSASDRISSSLATAAARGVRTNHQWTSYSRSRHLTYNSKRNTSYVSGLKPDVKRLLLRNDSSSSSSSEDDGEEEETVSEEHLNVIRKRQALLLVTIQTMTLVHHNQILEHKLSALHQKVIQIQKKRKTGKSE